MRPFPLDSPRRDALSSILVRNINQIRAPGRRVRMRRRSIAAAVLVIATMAAAVAATAGSAHRSSPTKLTIWVGWSAGHELTSFKKLIDEYNRNHTDVSVKVVGGIDDNKIVAAIRSGTAPDVVS